MVGQQILSLGAASSAIPSLLFSFLFILAIGPIHGFGVFFVALGLTGWAELTNTVNAAVRWVRRQPYMEGALALVPTSGHIVRRHLLPNLMPHLLPAIALEISAVLLTLGELGFLGVFLGEPFAGFVPQTIRTPVVPEWAGMLSGARLSFFQALANAVAGAGLLHGDRLAQYSGNWLEDIPRPDARETEKVAPGSEFRYVTMAVSYN